MAHKGLLWLALREEIDPDAKQQAKKFVDAVLQDDSQAELILEALINSSKGTPWWPWWKPYVWFVVKHLDSKDASIRLMAEKAADSKYIKKQMPKRTLDHRATIATLLQRSKIEQVAATISKAKGDAKHGQVHLARCLACHTTNANDIPKGPSLAGISERYDQAYIIDSIMRPSAVIAPGYVTQVFKMKDGRTLVGFITKQGADEVEMRDITGTTTTLRVKDIVEQTQLKTSMMPEGLLNDLTVEECASMLAYLNSLK